MASSILTPVAPATPSTSPQYRLPEERRQAILSQAPAAILHAKIEQQRLAFTQKFGDEFGLN